MNAFVFWLIRHLPALAAAAAGLLIARRLIHYFQLESYQFRGYGNTCLRQAKGLAALYIGLGLLWGALDLAAGRCFAAVPSLRETAVEAAGFGFFVKALALYGGAAALILLTGVIARQSIRARREKKPFVITARVKRLYVALGALLLICAWAQPAWTALLPLLVALAGLLCWPVERAIARMYQRDAQRRMDAQPGLIRIGITGSYGKTSVKGILNTLLSQKYNVLASPASFNTPMGLTRVIRERLEPAHQVFLAEMGARHRGDIRELTRLIKPSIGVLTAIGPQHLDTFKSLDAIIQTKYDLIRALPPDGFAAFYDDAGICADLYDKTTAVPRLIAGRKGGDAWAEEVRVTAQGSVFTLCLADGARIPCATRLLGAHNIGNILLSCAVARRLGLSDQQLKRGVEQLRPVEHRLQLLQSAGGVTVIDDAFNSNPHGAKAALDVLAAFPGRRIIVTPGMVELGAREKAFNRAFGRDMAACADVCVLIGVKHTQPIQEGLIEAGYPPAAIHAFPSLADATRWLQGFMRAGDFVLYENDLPDHYTE